MNFLAPADMNFRDLYMGRNIYYHTILGHILNRNNQTFMKLRKVLKEYFI
jgi:hypothetical protein